MRHLDDAIRAVDVHIPEENAATIDRLVSPGSNA
jgi:hypothetical protein